ncbi:MAG: histidine phosphatase family protein [Zetaproteobacteria bacterium]|nr:MAG: histidine phosphatase family protein [Zetaproteobacteria bacterium]
MLTIDLLRHGALCGGTRYRGRCDDALTDEGRAAMDAVWHAVADSVERIITSPLKRCRIPATDWAKAARIPLRIDPRLEELHYGEWEGKTMAEIAATHGAMLQQWRRDPSGMAPPGGEAMENFYQRLSDFWRQLLEKERGHVLIVGHSGVNRTLLAIALETSLATSRRMHLPYACWSRLRLRDGEVQLLFHNRRPQSPTTACLAPPGA